MSTVLTLVGVQFSPFTLHFLSVSVSQPRAHEELVHPWPRLHQNYFQGWNGEMHPAKQDKGLCSESGPNPLLLALPQSKSFHIENVPLHDTLLHDRTVYNQTM